MNTTTIKTSELQGDALDWAVAKAKGYADFVLAAKRFLEMHETGHYNYSTDWAQGGPIIEREEISLQCWSGDWKSEKPFSKCEGHLEWLEFWGSSPLIAAMRCYVASKLGDEVEVPEELR